MGSLTEITSATNVDYDPPSLIQTTWFRRVARASNSAEFCEDTTDPVRMKFYLRMKDLF